MKETQTRDLVNGDPELQRRAWDRQPGESHKAFAAFAAYRSLPANRTYQQVAQLLHCNGSNIRRWAGRWSWYARAREWDIHQDQIAQEEEIRERRQMAKRQARGAVLLQDIAVREADKLRQRLENPVLDEKTGKLVDYSLSANEIVKLYEIGTVAERRARGEGDEDRPSRIEVIFARKQPVMDDDEAPAPGE